MQPESVRVDDSILDCVSMMLTPSELRSLVASDRWTSLAAEDARRVVDALKEAADRYWRIDPRRSVKLAEVIIAIGEACNNTWIRALGTMAKGDAIKFIGSQSEAWNLLEEAGRLFILAGDEVGWGRTWIGRLSIATQLNRVSEAIAQARIARDIFVKHGQALRQLRIEMALGDMYRSLGDYRAALASYQHALSTATALGDAARNELCAIYNNIGVVELQSGELREALLAFERAHNLAIRQGEKAAAIICRNNIGVTLARQGHVREALKLLTEKSPEDAYLPLDAQAQLEKIECLLALNRYEEARDACLEARERLPAVQAYLTAAQLALHLATAQARLNDFTAAQAALAEAERLFAQLRATGLAMLARLRQGQVALAQHRWPAALEHAQACVAFFEAERLHHLYGEALLLLAGAFVVTGKRGDELTAARAAAQTATRIGRERGVPTLRFEAHTLLGRIAESQGKSTRALAHYKAAVSVMRRLQRDLTLTLRPTFMLDKLQPLRSIFRLHIRRGELADAFQAVEHERAQVILGYLTGREHLRWSLTDVHSRRLAEELTRLRETHHTLYLRLNDVDARPSFEQEQLRDQLRALENRMRAVTEQLYLRAMPTSNTTVVNPPDLAEIRSHLGEADVLVSYYSDGRHLHAFSLDRYALEHHLLPVDLEELDRLRGQLERNIARALTNPGLSGGLRPFALHILRRLDQVLIEPLRSRIHGRRRLFLVPYGPLHFLPFNLLHDGRAHLIEQVETVMLPSAGIPTRRGPAGLSGAMALTHDQDGRLPHIEAEARTLAHIFNAQCYTGGEATRLRLRAAPCQILHIAAHGEHRPEAPDFSYLELADGPLFTDDLLQLNLGYELVTLSACETGRARVACNDEVMGLGWAFLYAGAGAVISSLWRVNDADAAAFMEVMYRQLAQGDSKASAIRIAQRTMLDQQPSLHPARWGAFQIIGDAGPLS